MMQARPVWIFIAFILSASNLRAQVEVRDTLIQWQHFDYSMDANYSLASWSQNQIVDRTFSGIVVENELVKICLIPEFGARVISFIYKPTGREQLYQNPVGVPYGINSNIFYHDWLMVYGGIFPTFPEPEHGKYWNVPWNFTIEQETADRAVINMYLTDNRSNPASPGQYANGITGITCNFRVILEAGKPYFDVNVELVNNETSSNYEYWTCITFSPGSEIGNTFTPSQSEMIVPIDEYQVGWNPGDWMLSLDQTMSGSWPSIKKFDKLAHLSNWEEQGIAYAFPTLSENYYGVINHTNEEGLFRISSNQSKTAQSSFQKLSNQ